MIDDDVEECSNQSAASCNNNHGYLSDKSEQLAVRCVDTNLQGVELVVLDSARHRGL